jgi:hypothetical protein
MRLIRHFFETLRNAIARPPAISSFMCSGCDLNADCHLPASRRRLCWEARALRGRP